jgi:hypothetical protein
VAVKSHSLRYHAPTFPTGLSPRMTIPFAGNLDALRRWRSSLLARLNEFSRFLVEHDLSDAPCADLVATLRERLATDKVMVAFVAEFSRGKSELINAIFFADTGRRVLPASPGRTTMCPVELAYEADSPPSMALLPIESRLDGSTLSELRGRTRAWTHLALKGRAAGQLAEAAAQVMRTQWVSQDEAQALGFWDDQRPDDNPPVDGTGRVEIPVWRHALINYPHPLLQRGLVVLDTPGLNALGAEPELTLGLLPSAHATVFVLAADTGVTRSDLALWRDHLGPRSLAHYVVLNKIDTLRDPLLTPAQVGKQIEAQRRATARTLEIDPQCVFALSARDALTARIKGDARGLLESRLLELEDALGARLLRQRHELLQGFVDEAARQLQARAAHRLGERRRLVVEQILELRGLRGKSSARLRTAHRRVAVEAAEFEQCVVRMQALRAVHNRMVEEALEGLAGDRLRAEVEQMQQSMRASPLNLKARKAFKEMCARLRGLLAAAQSRGEEIHAMLGANHARLNAEFGFGLSLEPPPALQRFVAELDLIESGYVQYLGLNHALRLSQPRFMAPFRLMLLSKLRVVFESAVGEVDQWNRTASAQVDTQLGERRRAFRRRNEALERIQLATGELEQRIAELDAQDAALQLFLLRIDKLAEALRMQAPPESDAQDTIAPPITPPGPALRQQAHA